MKIVHITVLYRLREIQIEDTMIVYAICATMHDYVRNIHTIDVYILCKLKLFSHTSIHNTHTEKCRYLTTSAERSEKQEVKKLESYFVVKSVGELIGKGGVLWSKHTPHKLEKIIG